MRTHRCGAELGAAIVSEELVTTAVIVFGQPLSLVLTSGVVSFDGIELSVWPGAD